MVYKWPKSCLEPSVLFAQPGYLGLQWKDWGWHSGVLDSALFVLLTKESESVTPSIPGIFLYAQSDLWIPFGEPRWEAERGYLQSMVRHSLLSLHEAPMGLRDTPLQKGVIRRCRGLRGWGCLGDRDTPWLWNRTGGLSAHVAAAALPSAAAEASSLHCKWSTLKSSWFSDSSTRWVKHSLQPNPEEIPTQINDGFNLGSEGRITGWAVAQSSPVFTRQ